MAFTQSDLDAVEKAIARGELSVQQGDMRVQYRSMDELIAARNAIAAAVKSAGRKRQYRVYSSKGI